MHKPEKFGDDLSNVRLDFKYVNDTKKRISGFMQAKAIYYPNKNKQLFVKFNSQKSKIKQ